MSMTLEESILFYEEQAKKCNNKVNQIILGAERCEQDKQEYTQLAEWLRELQERRKQPEQKWIPCSERLPEDYKDVLITYTYSFELTCPQETAKLLKGAKTVSGNPIDSKVVWEVPFADYIAFYDADEKKWFSPTDNPETFPDEIKVIAWMPLPEPYKAEAERRTDDKTDKGSSC